MMGIRTPGTAAISSVRCWARRAVLVGRGAVLSDLLKS